MGLKVLGANSVRHLLMGLAPLMIRLIEENRFMELINLLKVQLRVSGFLCGKLFRIQRL